MHSSSICCYRYTSFWHLLTFTWTWCVHILDRLNEQVTALPTYMGYFLISCFLTIFCNFAVFYAFLAMHFLSDILYLWIIFEFLLSPPSHSHCNSLCRTAHCNFPCSWLLLPRSGKAIRQPLRATQGQDKGPGTSPLALSGGWTDESAAASRGMAWELGKSLLSTCAAPLPLGVWGSPSPFAPTHQQTDGENSGWLQSATDQRDCRTRGKDIQPGASG